MSEKIGVGITTYNSENYFKALYDSLPFDKIDELIVINGGDRYKDTYDKCDWIQHKSNKFPSVCRNDALRFLSGRGVDHYFLIEDDMIIKNPNIFDEYVAHSKASKIEYLCFASTSFGGGTPEKRTPKLTVEFTNNKKISMYPNMCNEFTYRSSQVLGTRGYYDENFRHIFDVINVYKICCDTNYATPFWWFPDISDSDNYIMNNPVSVSRLQSNNKREQELPLEMEKFKKMFGYYINEIAKMDEKAVLTYLKAKFK